MFAQCSIHRRSVRTLPIVAILFAPHFQNLAHACTAQRPGVGSLSARGDHAHPGRTGINLRGGTVSEPALIVLRG
jgi:hypothetical protein